MAPAAAPESAPEAATAAGVVAAAVSVELAVFELLHPATDTVTASSEDAPIRASSPYSASKAGGDLQVLAYVRTYGADALVTRGANTYGARQYPEKFLPLFIPNV